MQAKTYVTQLLLMKLVKVFLDLQKDLNRVSRMVLWLALCVVSVPECLVKVVQAIYVSAGSRTPVTLLLVRYLKQNLGYTGDQY